MEAGQLGLTLAEVRAAKPGDSLSPDEPRPPVRLDAAAERYPEGE